MLTDWDDEYWRGRENTPYDEYDEFDDDYYDDDYYDDFDDFEDDPSYYNEDDIEW